MTDRIGQQLGNYRLVRLLGQGGFADVYLGEHIHLKSLAALKILHISLSDEEQAAFLEEAKMLVLLTHPHIVRILDFAMEDKLPFMVTEFAPNGNLREQYPVGSRLSLETIITYVQQVSAALQYAHDRELVHCDIKPENMLLDSHSKVVLSDFGLSVMMTQQHSSYSTHEMAQRVAGTSLYLAPEQLRGHPQPSSDQYALGIVVYEWLCGHPPFQGSPLEIALQHLSIPPPSLREQAPDIPTAIEKVVQRALAKEPEQRFVRVQDFATALEQIIEGGSTSPPSFHSSELHVGSELFQSGVKPEPIWKVPTSLTPLIGREQDMAAIITLLRNSEVRLLTLIGTGGIGKTRLAFQVAKEMRTDFVDGVCFVQLALVSDSRLVVSTIAQELDIRILGVQPIFEQLKHWLTNKHLLLILDNFEQVIAAAPLMEDLLVACPLLKIVITSREVLHLQAEYEYPVSPLALPDLKQLPTIDEIPQYTAIALFIQRAQVALHTFQITPSNVRAVAEICTQLDGLPLAIELAAARVKLLPPYDLLARLSQRFEILTSGIRTLPTRQQTLRNTLKWSYDLLNTREQQLFRRLSVFVRNWTIAAVEAVCYETPQEAASALDEISSLFDKSLLLQTEREGEAHFTMLLTVREYGLECLRESSEAERIQRAHARYYLTMAEEVEPEYFGTQATAVLDKLEREYENLRAAFQWMSKSGEIEMALRLGGALWWFWYARGHLSEGRQLMDLLLSRSEGVAASVRAKALISVGWFAYQQKDFVRAETLLNESLELYRSLGDKQQSATSLYRLGQVAWAKGDFPALQILAEEALKLYYELGTKDGIADSLLLLSYAATERGDYARAHKLAEQAATIFKGIGDQWAISYTLADLARVVLLQGDPVTAQTLIEESFALSIELGYMGNTASCLEHLAEVVATQDQLSWAALLCGAAEHLRDIIAIPLGSTQLADYEHIVAAVRSKLGEEAFKATWSQGRSMTPQQAFAMQEYARTLDAAFIRSQLVETVNPQSLSTYPDHLTVREVEILRLVAEGQTDAQIADQLVISPRTVNAHLTSIYRKIQVSSRSAATRYAIEHNLI
jgi:predicted ATPase/DNA-binding CsgD family transcriptional regulator